MKHSARIALGLMLAAGTGAVWPHAVRSQTLAPTGPSTPPTAAPAPTSAPAASIIQATPEMRRIAARALTRAALIDVRLSMTPDVEEFRCVKALLTLAHELDPADTDILRLLIESAGQAGDSDAVELFTRDLLKLDPSDAVAQLRVVAGRIGKLQTVQQRLAAYDRFLGREGESIDASVRSRLALDAALLRRELGQAEEFAIGLRKALSLDSTNAEAASLLLAYVTAGEHTLAERLEAHLMVLMADPLNPDTHLTLAREAASAGAAAQAIRFIGNYEAIVNGAGGSIPALISAERVTARWVVEGAGKVAAEMGESVARARRQTAAANERMKDPKNAPPPGATPPTPTDPLDIRLSNEAERLWVVASSFADDPALLERALTDAAETLRRFEQNAADPSKRPDDATDEEVRRALAERRADAAWVLLLTGSKTDVAAALIKQVEADPEARAGGLNRLNGWLRIRQGDIPGGRAALEPLAERDPLSALGLGLADELDGKKEQAAERFADLADELAGSLGGAWAYTRAQRLGHTLAPRVHTRTVAAMLDGVPKFIDEMIRDPRRFLQLEVSAKATNLRPLDKAEVNVSLRNVSPMPLPLGAERAINSRLLVSPTLDVGASPVKIPASEVMNLERRLRLKPGEAVADTIWPECGYGGWATELLAGELVRVRWRVLQGFRITAQGVTEAGSNSLAAGTETVVKPPFLRAGLSVIDLTAALAAPALSDIPDLLAVARWRLARDSRGLEPMPPIDRDALAAALASLFGRLDEAGKLMVLGMMPGQTFIKAIKPLDDAAAADAVRPGAERVAIAYIVTRITEPTDPIFELFNRAESTAVRDTAAAMKRRLQINPRSFSRMAPSAVAGGTPPPSGTTRTGVQSGTEPAAPADPLSQDPARPRPPGGP